MINDESMKEKAAQELDKAIEYLQNARDCLVDHDNLPCVESSIDWAKSAISTVAQYIVMKKTDK